MTLGDRDNIDQLIVDLGLGIRDASGLDLEAIRLHVSAAGFDPQATFPADRRVVGHRRTSGRIIQFGDQIPTAELHFLRHVVSQQEWPSRNGRRGPRKLSTRAASAILPPGYGSAFW